MSDGYENLANAIIQQAVRDWQSAVKKLKKRPRYDPAKQTKEECEQFFLSEWFEQLTSVNGGYLLRKLKQEEGINDG